MYRCQDCGKEFEYVEVVFEKHGLDTPPFERIKLCPYCHSNNYVQKEEHFCFVCGSKLREGADFCSPACRKKSKDILKREEQRRDFLKNSPIMKSVKEVEEYNKAKGTKYSYGTYFALKSKGVL